MRHSVLENETKLSLQMAPMINVMLVLLAAFVATVGVVENEKWLSVAGHQKGSSSIFTESAVIEIDSSGQLYFNQVLLAGDSLQQVSILEKRMERLMKLAPDQAVIIKPHGDTVHQRVVQVVEVCKITGVKKLSFGEKT